MSISTQDLLISIASSATVSTILSSIITMRLAKRQHVYEYEKIVIQKRVDAYEALEKLLMYFTDVSYSQHEDATHSIFFRHEGFDGMLSDMRQVWNAKIWMNPDTEQKFIQLYRILHDFDTNRYTYYGSPESVDAFAVKNYRRIDDITTELYALMKADYSTLHDLSRLKKKKKQTRSASRQS